MDGDGRRPEHLRDSNLAHEASHVLLFGRDDFDSSRASWEETNRLRQRIAALSKRHSDLSSDNNFQLAVGVLPDPDNRRSPCLTVIDSDQCAYECYGEQPSVWRYAGDAAPSVTNSQRPSRARLPALLAYAASALDGLLIASGESTGPFRCPLSAVWQSSPNPTIATGTLEPRPVDSGSILGGNRAADDWFAGPYGLPAGRRVLALNEPVTIPVQPTVISLLVTVSGALQDSFREDLLRLVDGIQAVLWRTLLLVLSLLMRRRGGFSFTLILLAVARRYGRRGEPDHYLLPANDRCQLSSGRLRSVPCR